MVGHHTAATHPVMSCQARPCKNLFCFATPHCTLQCTPLTAPPCAPAPRPLLLRRQAGLIGLVTIFPYLPAKSPGLSTTAIVLISVFSGLAGIAALVAVWIVQRYRTYLVRTAWHVCTACG